MKGVPETTNETWICHACGFEWYGASRKDCLEEGWKFITYQAVKTFSMCGECVAKYKPIWDHIKELEAIPELEPVEAPTETAEGGC